MFGFCRTIKMENAVFMAAALAVVLGISGFAYASDKTENMKVRISAVSDIKALSNLSNEEYQAVSLSAGRILHHVESARIAIANGKKSDALRHVDQGLKLVQIIENAVPKHKVSTKIKSGNVSYSDEEDVALRYVDIYDEQHIEDIITPLVQARKENAFSHKSETTGNESGNTSEFGETVTGQYTSMKLDILIAKRMLEAAKKDLKDGKVDDADDDLLTLEDSAIAFIYNVVELSLAEAADNLKLAQFKLNNGLKTEALATLKLASDDLKEYEKEAGESRAKEARQLHQEIDKLIETVKNENGLKTIVGRTIKQIGVWWTKTVNWMRN